MPSAENRLRERYMVNGQDGIDTCEKIIESFGSYIDERYTIIVLPAVDELSDENREEFWDAVSFLIEEWDYGIEKLL